MRSPPPAAARRAGCARYRHVHTAAEGGAIRSDRFPENAAALGASELRRNAVTHLVFNFRHIQLRYADFALGSGVIFAAPSQRLCRFLYFFRDQLSQQVRHTLYLRDTSRRHTVQRALWHGGKHGCFRILDDRGSAVRMNDHQAGSTVIQHSSEHNADDPAPVSHRGRAERGIDGRAVTIFTRSAKSAYLPLFHHHV